MKNKDRLMYLEEMSDHAFDRIAALEASVAILQERDKERMEAQPARTVTFGDDTRFACVLQPKLLTPNQTIVLRDLRDRIRGAKNVSKMGVTAKFSQIEDEVLEVLDQIFGGEA